MTVELTENMESLKTKLPKVFISEEQISKRVKELGKEISEFFRNKLSESEDESLVIIGVLKGAFAFTADLVRHLEIPVQVEFVKIASYGDKTHSSGTFDSPYLSLPANLSNRNILIVEDIVDTGQTSSFLTKYIREQFRPKELKLVSFLDKPSRRVIQTDPDFYGFRIEDKFVIGYGLDYAEKYRELKYLGVLGEID